MTVTYWVVQVASCLLHKIRQIRATCHAIGRVKITELRVVAHHLFIPGSERDEGSKKVLERVKVIHYLSAEQGTVTYANTSKKR
jgi:hypothetical protein